MKQQKMTQKRHGGECKGNRFTCDALRQNAKLKREQGELIDPKAVFDECMSCQTGGDNSKLAFLPSRPGSRNTSPAGVRLTRGPSAPFLLKRNTTPFVSTTHPTKARTIIVIVKRGELTPSTGGGRRRRTHRRRTHRRRHTSRRR